MVREGEGNGREVCVGRDGMSEDVKEPGNRGRQSGWAGEIHSTYRT